MMDVYLEKGNEMSYQYWLAEVDGYGTGWMVDGPHNDEQGAQEAYYLFKQLGLKKNMTYAVAKVELFPVTEENQPINEEAAALCKEMIDNYKTKETK